MKIKTADCKKAIAQYILNTPDEFEGRPITSSRKLSDEKVIIGFLWRKSKTKEKKNKRIVRVFASSISRHYEYMCTLIF